MRGVLVTVGSAGRRTSAGRSRWCEESVFPLCRVAGPLVRLVQRPRPADGRHALRGDATTRYQLPHTGRQPPDGAPLAAGAAACRLVPRWRAGIKDPLFASRRVAPRLQGAPATSRDRLPLERWGSTARRAATPFWGHWRSAKPNATVELLAAPASAGSRAGLGARPVSSNDWFGWHALSTADSAGRSWLRPGVPGGARRPGARGGVRRASSPCAASVADWLRLADCTRPAE
jgi:hypothetical protein